MNLQEVIRVNETPGLSCLIENMLPYKKMLLVYFANYFCCKKDDLILVVTSVTNATAYGFITGPNEVIESVQDWCADDPENEREDNIETILSNSIELYRID